MRMAYSGVLYTFSATVGPPNVAGPGVTYLLYPTLLTRLLQLTQTQTESSLSEPGLTITGTSKLAH